MREKQLTCKRGHDLTNPANVKPRADGGRQCRPCQLAAQRRSHEKWRAANPPRVKPVPPDKDDCEVEDCDRPRASNGKGGRHRHCTTHRHRLATHGDLFADVPIEQTHRSLAARRAALQA